MFLVLKTLWNKKYLKKCLKHFFSAARYNKKRENSKRFLRLVGSMFFASRFMSESLIFIFFTKHTPISVNSIISVSSPDLVVRGIRPRHSYSPLSDLLFVEDSLCGCCLKKKNHFYEEIKIRNNFYKM